MSDQNPVSFRITARSSPTQGALAVQKIFDFTGGVLIREGDLFEETERGLIDYIQSVKIDNSQNMAPFSLQFEGIGTVGDTVICPAQSVLYSPVLIAAQQTPRFIAASAGGVVIAATFLNIELPYFVYSTAPQVNTTPSVIHGVETNHSLILAAGTQIIIPANPQRQRAVIQNVANNANSVWIKSGGAATADNFSQEILPGQQFDTNAGPLTTAALNIIGTAGDAVYASEISL